jgi:hypothetical protein
MLQSAAARVPAAARSLVMPASVLADLVVLLHAAFVAYVVAGGLLVFRRPWTAAVHLPAVAWTALLEFNGWICPLTPWENALRARAGETGYAGGFVDHYLLPLLYPAGLTPGTQVVLGFTVLAVNLVVYGLVVRHRINLRRGA